MSQWDTPAGREGLAAWRAERADLVDAIDRLPCVACRRTHAAFGVEPAFRVSYATSEAILTEACNRIATASNALR